MHADVQLDVSKVQSSRHASSPAPNPRETHVAPFRSKPSQASWPSAMPSPQNPGVPELELDASPLGVTEVVGVDAGGGGRSRRRLRRRA
ncbi:MAG: hypothetical protein U0414_33985 [Polyangiaceae bacterium]